MKKVLITIITILLASAVGCNQNSEGPQGSSGEQGEQGDVGSTGSQGSQGEQGNRGSTGPSLKVVDANDVLVGYPLSIQKDSTQVISDLGVFDTNVNKYIRYDFNTALPNIPVRNSLSYASSDCSGMPLIGGANIPYMVFKFSGDDKMYSAGDYSDVVSGWPYVYSQLKLNKDDNLLVCSTITAYTQFAANVHLVVLPSYAGPLRIVIE